MSEFEIKRAERKQVKLRLAFQGPSGSGKTATALLVAKGIIDGMVAEGLLPHAMDPRIGVIDTERQSASLYSHIVPFDTIELGPPYTTERYAKALHALEHAGYPVIIIDSLSHEWVGKGGILSLVDHQFGEWKDATPVHDEFVDAILRSPAHLMVTMRSKTAWVIELKENRAGRMVNTPVRVGTAPVQRPGIEYEFTTLLALDTDMNKATVLKDRTEMFGAINSVIPRLKPEDGGKLVKWLLAGAPMATEDTIGATAEIKALAITEAAERNFSKAPTVPDLGRLFAEANKALGAFNGPVSTEVLLGYQRRLIVAKDKRKADFGITPEGSGAAAASGVETISPEGAAQIEEMLLAGRLKQEGFLAEFQLTRIGMLPLTRWAEATGWIVAQAGANGYEVRACDHPVYTPPPAEPTLQEKARDVMDKVGARRAGGSMFAAIDGPDPGAAATRALIDMEDDIPF